MMKSPVAGTIFLLLLLSVITGISCDGDDVANPDMLPPAAGDFTPKNCWNFSIGDWERQEFYSPNYPDNYLNNTECMQLLTAPPGFRIRLDFRDDFHIETSEECKYDFLELRNGPFGYSPLVGRFCGKKHPPLVDSTTRFLWIRFKSDESIEYSGFRAVYEFVKTSPPNVIGETNSSLCRIDVELSDAEGGLHTSDIPERFLRRSNVTQEPVDCTWVLYGDPGHRFYMRWVDFVMSTPQDCDDSFMELYDRTTATSDRRKQVCGMAAREFKSVSNHVYLRVYAKSALLLPRFQTLFTIFTPGPCTSSQFDCGDSSCIPLRLRCNGINNCNYSWDEEKCDEHPPTTEAPVDQPIVITYSTIILGCVGGFIVTIISLAVFVTCHQHRKEKRRRMLALKQDKRHNVEMTTLLNRSSSPCLSPARPHNMRNHIDGKVNRNGNVHGIKDDGEPLTGKDFIDGPTFQRFRDDDTLPNATGPFASVVSVEKHSSPRRPSPKSSPRRDIPRSEQNSLFPLSDTKRNTNPKRRLSLETVHSERSDVWKPNVSPLPAQRAMDHMPYGVKDTPGDYSRSSDYPPQRVYGFELFRDPRYGPAPDVAHLRRVSRSASNELDLYDDYSQFDRAPYDHDHDRRQYRHDTLPYSRTYSGSLSDSRYRSRGDQYDPYDHPRREYYAAREYRDYRDPREYRGMRDYRDRGLYEGDDRRRASYGEHLSRSPRREPRLSHPDRHSSSDRMDRRRMPSFEDRLNRSPSKSYYRDTRDAPSPDVFYTRPNRSVQQHHPV